MLNLLKEKGFTVLENPGNGDCLPYAIGDFILEYKGAPGKLREQVVDYVRMHWKKIGIQHPDSDLAIAFQNEQTAEEWMNKAGTPQEWCELTFAFVVALMLR
mgnify:CR=1 FL=1